MGIFFMERAPVMYYLYAIFPFFFWATVFEYRHSLIEGLKLLIWSTAGKRQNTSMSLLAQLLGFFVLMEAIVAGYFHREIFSVIFVLISIWPLLQNSKVSKENKLTVAAWFICCWAMSVFTLLPVVKVEDVMLM